MYKKLSLVLITMCFSIHVWAKDVYVEGYTRSDGTVVQGHYRSAPDNTINNNFSTKGNINPYTGKPGWIDREEHTGGAYVYESTPYSSSPELNDSYSSNQTLVEKTRRYQRVDGDTLLISGTIALLLILPLGLFTFQFLSSPKSWAQKYQGAITVSLLSRASFAVFSVMIIAYLASFGPI